MIKILRLKVPILFFTVISCMSFTCSQNMLHNSATPGAKDKSPRDTIVRLTPDQSSLIKNPLMGWAIYSDGYRPDMDFWKKFDALEITRYATHLYIRWPWSAFEPEQGQYAWNHDDFFTLLEDGAKERGLKLALRIYVDSRDYNTSSTPQYVRAAGAKGESGNTNQWSPYPDDLIFQKSYAAFLQAFAAQFDNPDIVDYVDGFGLGKWGEGHSMILADENNYDQMYDWIVKLYDDCFKNILVAINYHVDIGKERIHRAVTNHGYILRHDAFGMGYYYTGFERAMVQTHFPNRPIIAESGWWHNGSTHWMHDDPANYKSWREVWQQTLQDALDERANTLDLRNISESTSWIQTAPDLVQRFIEEGGYRLYPSEISFPDIIVRGKELRIGHTWHNLGVGICPNNVKQWDYKYKVGFALLDRDSQDVKAILVDHEADPSQWIRGQANSYELATRLDEVPLGRYYLAVAIIDSSKGNHPGLNLAISGVPNQHGWWKLGEVTVE